MKTLGELISEGKDRIFIKLGNDINGWEIVEFDYLNCSTVDQYWKALDELREIWKNCQLAKETGVSFTSVKYGFKNLTTITFTDKEINEDLAKYGRISEFISVPVGNLEFYITINKQ